MKKYLVAISLLIVIGAVYWSYLALMPQDYTKLNISKNKFSTERALLHVKAISKKPHYVGSKNHSVVKNYIVGELEKIGLTVEIQEGNSLGDWATLSKVSNIV